MAKIDKYIPQTDKLKHFYLWTLLFLGLAIILTFIFEKKTALIMSYVFTVLTAAFKEIVKDWLKAKGTPEMLDFLFSILAPTLSIILCYICLKK